MCAQESHWHVRNANSVTTIQQRIKRHILTEWRSGSIVDFAESIRCTKRQSKDNFAVTEWASGRDAKVN